MMTVIHDDKKVLGPTGEYDFNTFNELISHI